jgi:hypothetical protein
MEALARLPVFISLAHKWRMVPSCRVNTLSEAAHQK